MPADPSAFSTPSSWFNHGVVRAYLERAVPLSIQHSAVWRCCGGKLEGSRIPSAAQRVGVEHCGPSVNVRWRVRETRRETWSLQVADAVVLVVFSGRSLTAVNVLPRGDVNDDDWRMALFRTVAVIVTGEGTASAVVQPCVRDADNMHWRLMNSLLLYLRLDGVRRAIVQHDCRAACAASAVGAMHNAAGRFLLFGKEAAYPPRSG